MTGFAVKNLTLSSHLTLELMGIVPLIRNQSSNHSESLKSVMEQAEIQIAVFRKPPLESLVISVHTTNTYFPAELRHCPSYSTLIYGLVSRYGPHELTLKPHLASLQGISLLPRYIPIMMGGTAISEGYLIYRPTCAKFGGKNGRKVHFWKFGSKRFQMQSRQSQETQIDYGMSGGSPGG